MTRMQPLFHRRIQETVRRHRAEVNPGPGPAWTDWRLVAPRLQRQGGPVAARSRELPIYELETALVARLTEGRRLILQAPPAPANPRKCRRCCSRHGLLGATDKSSSSSRAGSPRACWPRASRHERGVRLGEEVGYQIRLDNVASASTRIRFVTEGILLRQMLGDPELARRRPPSSSTNSTSAIFTATSPWPARCRFAGTAPAGSEDRRDVRHAGTRLAEQISRSRANSQSRAGGCFRWSIEYLPQAGVDRPRRCGNRPPRRSSSSRIGNAEGDVLIFMPGAFEIQPDASQRSAHSRLGREWIRPSPLHGELPPAEQDAAVARYRRQRKVVVSTNVAETSLTIDGVRLVIDCGLARIARFDPYRGINTLLIEKISRASADQRAGRAGRTAPGRCMRLVDRARTRTTAPPQELPEVRRLDLAEVVLTLKASGIDDVRAFRWLEPPERRSLDARGRNCCTDLGALDTRDRRTDAHRPADARVSRASALRPHAAGGAGVGLRAAGGPAGGLDAIAQPVHPQ